MFENSLRKLARALDHQAELRARFGDYVGKGSITLEATTEGEDMQFMSAVVKEKPPKYLSLVIGDTIHNLRSSLDYLTSELLRIKGVSSRVSFPMHETEANLRNLMDTGVLGREYPEMKDIILSEVRSFDQGKLCIWHIGQFDNQDKHKLVLPTVSVSRIVGASFHTAHMHCVMCSLDVGAGNKIVGYQSQSPEPFIVDNPGTAQAALLFPENGKLPNADVILSLQAMSHLVLDTINLFGRRYDPNWADKSIEYSKPKI